MLNVLDIDLNDPKNRAIAAGFIRRCLASLVAAAPKRELIAYGGLIVGLLLWLVPLSKKLHPSFTLAFTMIGAGAIAVSASELEALQDEVDDRSDQRKLKRALAAQTIEAVATTEHYSMAQLQRLQTSQLLPEHLLEPDLAKPPALPEAKTEEQRFDEFMQSAQGSASSAGSPAKSAATRATSQDAQASAKGKLIDLTGKTEYAGLPIEDLAQCMAADFRGCVGVGSTGCGKSSLIRQAIIEQQQLDETTDFTVFAHKSANEARGEKLDYAGMEDSDDCIVFTASQRGLSLRNTAEKFETRLHVLTGLIERGSGVPAVVVIDQSNQGLVACQKAAREAAAEDKQTRDRKDRHDPPFKHLAVEYEEFLNTGLVDGREKWVRLWLFGHSNTNEGVGVSHQIKQNVYFVALGRAGNYDSVWNPLKDNRFIAGQEERDRLAAQLRAYLKQHRAAGAPANVVVALTNCGDRGWRLIVLPQYTDGEDIELNVVNPPREDLPSSEPEESTVRQGAEEQSVFVSEPPAPEIDSIDAVRAQLERTVNSTTEQIEQAREFVLWLRSHAAIALGADGAFNFWSAWAQVPGVASPEQLEICLQLINEQGGGSFEQHGDRTVWRPSEKLLPSPAQVAQEQEARRAAMAAAVAHIKGKTVGTLHTPKTILDSSRILRQQHSLTVDDIKKLLVTLAARGLVQVVNRDQFQILPSSMWDEI